MTTLLQDLRYGIRMLAKNPGFTAVAVLTLALGIGANTAIFSAINVVLLRTLPVSHPEELVTLRWESPHNVTDYLPYPLFDRLRQDNEVLAGMFGFHGLRLATNFAGRQGLAAGQLVSGNYFSVLGVKTIIGRRFTAEEDRVPGGAPFAVISYGYWKRQFGLDPSVVGKSIVLNGVPFTIIGVTSPDFFGVSVGASPEIWIPMVMQAAVMDGRSLLNDPRSWWLEVMARRKPGINAQQATAALNVLYQRIARQQAGAELSREAERELSHEKIALVPGSKGLSDLRNRFSEPLLILMMLVGILLLTASANIASLALARATGRQKEMAVRAALGAGQLRLVQQSLTESFLLAGLGGAFGLLTAFWADDLLVTLLSRNGTPLALSLHPDALVFAFAAGVAILSGILFGSAPAWRAARTDLNAEIKGSGTTVADPVAKRRPRWGLLKQLVAVQVAMSLVMLVGAGMLVRSLQKLENVEPGFDPTKVLLVAVDPTLAGYQGPRLMNLYRELAVAVSEVPGVRSASFCAPTPMSGAHWSTGVFAQGHVPGPNETTTALMNLIGPNFFKTLRIPLVRGRDFTERDDASAPEVAIINETMARFYFDRASPIGKRLSFLGPQGGEIEIVGVAQDIKYSSLREATPRVIYLPYLQTPAASLPFGMTLELLTAGNPDSFTGSVRDAMRKVASNLPILGFRTLAEQVNGTLGQERLVADLAAFFGMLALILASVGLYGVLTYVVSRQTREIGIRVALGARRADVFSMVLRDALRLVAVGASCGLPLAVAFARLISSQLYGISPYDPSAISVATALLATVSAIAIYVPARRATKVDPMTALRYE
jgi:putative ABC transport system permease protein